MRPVFNFVNEGRVIYSMLPRENNNLLNYKQKVG